MAELLRNPDVAIALISTVGAVVVGIVAIFKGGDLLRELRRRKMFRLRGKLQHTCPHAEFITIETDKGEQTLASFFFETYMGITHYECRVCRGKTTKRHVEELQKFLAGHSPKERKTVNNRLKKAENLRKKLDSLGNWVSLKSNG